MADMNISSIIPKKIDMLTPREVTIKTSRIRCTDPDSRAPYDATQIQVVEKTKDGKIWHADYCLTQPEEEELKKLNEIISSIYYKNSHPYEEALCDEECRCDSFYAPPIGKDGDV